MSIWNLNTPTDQTTEPKVQNALVVDKEETESSQQAENNPDKIVLDGPLSKIYTEALNKIYAKEDMAGMITTSAADDQPVDDRDLYVYCCTSSDVDEDTELVTNKIVEASKHDQKVIAIECDNYISQRMGMIESLSRDLGVKVYLTRRSALEAIHNKSNKKTPC